MKMKYHIMTCILLSFITLSSWGKDNRYRVTTFGDNFLITSPYGSKIFIGDIGLTDLRSYRFEIPIEDLKNSLYSSLGNDRSFQGKENSQPKFVESEEELILQANHLYGQGKFSESLTFVEEALRRNSKNIRGWVMKGSLMHVQGQTDLAKIYWNKALKLEPNNEQIKKLLGK